MKIVKRGHHGGSSWRKTLVKKAAREGGKVLSYGVKRLKEYVRNKRRTPGNNQRAPAKFARNLIQGDDVHSGINTNRINLVLHKSLKHKTLARWKFAQISSSNFTARAGEQGVTILWGINHRNNFLTNAANPSSIEIFRNLFELNNNRQVTGSNFIPAQMPDADRMCVFHCTVTHMLTNMSTIPVVMYLYYVTPKRDSLVFCDTLWGNACATEGMTVANHVSPGAGVYNAGATWGSTLNTDWHNKPDYYKNWNTFFRIMKVKKVVLAAGATQELVIRVAVNKLVNREQLTNSVNDNVRGLTVDCLATIYGAAVEDVTAGANIATIGAAKVASVVRKHWTCGQIKDGSARVDDAFVYQQIPFNSSIANERQVDAVDAIAPVEQG